MNIFAKSVLFLSIVPAIAFADANCTDTSLTKPEQCSCIISNAVADCETNSPIKSICNIPSLTNYFKQDPNGAMAQCERYRDKSTPDECEWSVTFYDQNC